MPQCRPAAVNPFAAVTPPVVAATENCEATDVLMP
jgi:hypothetical protein